MRFKIPFTPVFFYFSIGILLTGIGAFQAQAQTTYLKGNIKDTLGNPIPYASVYNKNTTYGVTSNYKGDFIIELKPGEHDMVFSFVGYVTHEEKVQIKPGQQNYISIVLKEENKNLSEVIVYANKRDIAKEIMKNARDNRKNYLDNIEGYSNETYQKTTIEKESPIDDNDSIPIQTRQATDLKYFLKKEKLNFIEVYSEIHFSEPSKFKETILAHNDYSIPKNNINEASVGFSVGYGGDDIVPNSFESSNPYMLINNASDGDFNFYKPFIKAPTITSGPILSPLAPTAPANYLFDYDGVIYENGKKIHVIKVTPIFEYEALFSGTVFIEDSTWALVSVDLHINSSALLFCKKFNLIQNYREIEPGAYLPVRKEFTYTIKEGKSNILGKTRIDHSNYIVNPEFEKKFFSNEVRSYETDAFDKDSTFWMEKRTFALLDNEKAFINKADSMVAFYSSEDYLRKLDSSYNDNNIWSFLINGVGYRNQFKQREFYFEPLTSQIIPFGVGGWRHRFGGHYNQGFKNDYLLETRGHIDYGFNNKDIRGKLGVGLTYVPKKFVRTFIDVGDYYEFINDFASLTTMLSRSNYVRTKTFSIAQRVEIINGLFGELTFHFSDSNPIDDIDLNSDLTNFIFGTYNTPIEFERYIKSEIKLELKYRIKQEYIIKKNKKILLPPKYPMIKFVYRKGIPGLFNSEVDFDYIEIGTEDQLKIGRMGTSAWSVDAGAFVNSSNLRVLEHRYFRGSDRFLFSNPLKSFQLLGPTLSSSSSFFRANYIHHFEGAILGKIPLINRTKITLAAGLGTLIIPENDFSHFEMFVGLERVIRIRKQLFRLGVFAVTADNSFSSPTLEFKMGIDLYDSFRRKWSY